MSTIVTNVSWANDQQFYKKNQQLLLNGNIKPIVKKNNEQLLQRSKDITTTINKYIKIKKEENIDPWKFLEHKDRIQFQIEGYDGPQTYIFGFDTGYGFVIRIFKLNFIHNAIKLIKFIYFNYITDII